MPPLRGTGVLGMSEGCAESILKGETGSSRGDPNDPFLGTCSQGGCVGLTGQDPALLGELEWPAAQEAEEGTLLARGSAALCWPRPCLAHSSGSGSCLPSSVTLAREAPPQELLCLGFHLFPGR